MNKVNYLIFSVVLICGCHNSENIKKADKEHLSEFTESLYIKSQSSNLNKDGYEIYVHKYIPSRRMLKYFWPNGKIQLISFFNGVEKDGKWTEYFENGAVAGEAFFKNGLKDSIHKTYHKNGKLAALEYYKSGKEVGKWEYFDSSGVLQNAKRHN